MGTRSTKASNAYHRRSSKQYHLEFHKKNDADIIRKLETVDNKQGYIKALIRYDIKRGHNE
nr:MAG TPA: hypothetical protein [Caudoviricetes sp.]